MINPVSVPLPEPTHAVLIHLGINLGFARYVWSPETALDMVRDELGLGVAEPVAENDFGAALYLNDPAAFVRRHEAIGLYARRNNMLLPTVFTFYRDGGAVSHPDPAVREAAMTVLRSLAVQASALGTRYACAALMTAEQDIFQREPGACLQRALDAWKGWMAFARGSGLRGLLVEMSAQSREDCATIAQTRATLQRLGEYHAANPDTTVPVELCYDLGHGISPAEAPDDAERDFRAWFRAFPTTLREIHVKNTDRDFLATWPFTPEHEAAGIIKPAEVVAAVQEHLQGEVYLVIEIAGKRGRTIGEQQILKDLKATVGTWEEALRAGGCKQRSDGAWASEGKPCQQ